MRGQERGGKREKDGGISGFLMEDVWVEGVYIMLCKEGCGLVERLRQTGTCSVGILQIR